MKLIKKISLSCFVGTIVLTLQAQAKSVPDSWKTECVSYFQISVPGEIEVGVAKGGHDPSKSRHALDVGTYEFFESSIYLGGTVRASPIRLESSFSSIKNERRVLIEELKQQMKGDPSIRISEYNVNQNSITSLFDSKQESFGSTFFYQAGRIYSYRQSGEDSGIIKANQTHFSKNFRPRALYELPEEKGFCLPYGFVKDNTPQERSMGTIMRLKDHPDVKILFRDQSAFLLENYSREENATVEQELRAFWEHADWGAVKYQALGFRKFPSVEIAGYKGRSTFVEMTRPHPSPNGRDKCTWDDENFEPGEKKPTGCPLRQLDYGYIAYVKGDPDAKEDTPNLLLYVMQNSEDGPGGKATLGKDELRKMADTIAASIKRR